MSQYTLKDLLIAYRKVKADMYFDKNNISLLRLADFEKDLLQNLNEILHNLNNNNLLYFTSSEFVGGINVSLKSIYFDTQMNEGVLFSDEFDHNKEHKIKHINYRYVGDLSIEFQILGSLWIDKIGIHLEKRLSKNSYGCRLDRQESQKNDPDDYDNLNGHFRPYFFDYKAWQEDSLKSISDSLKDKKKIAVLSTDIKGFYHSINPLFLGDYFNSQGTDLTEFSILNSIFSASLLAWSRINFDQVRKLNFEVTEHLGIPIGLSASKVIANLYLEELDEEIDKCLNPIFYGRYVDDIILAIEDKEDFANRNQLWKFIESRLNKCSFRSENNKKELSFEKSHVVSLSFNREKEKIFLLKGKSGLALIETIKSSMIENSSEWRILPDAEHDIDNLNKQFTSSTTDNNEPGTTLRKADGVSIQRLKFSLRLRNFEKLILIAPQNEWEKPLKEFVEICSDFIINPGNISTFAQYIPRIFGLITSSGNLNFLETILKSYKLTFEKIQYGIPKNSNSRLRLSKDYLDQKIVETILANQNFNDKNVTNAIENLLLSNSIIVNLSSKKFRTTPVKLFLCDLHKIPFKSVFLDSKIIMSKEILKKNFSYFTLYEIAFQSDTINLNLLRHFIKENGDFKKLLSLNFIPNALYFCTRKFSALELSLIFTNWSHSTKNQKKFEEYLKLFSIRPIELQLQENYVGQFGTTNNMNFIKLSTNKKVQNPNIILTNYYTDSKSWVANVRNDNFEPDISRYTRLNRLINNILEEIRKNKISLQYIILPELSMPRQSVIEIAKKLKSKGISLIVGLEYQKKLHTLKNSNGTVSNQLLFVLNAFNGLSYDQLAITQEKTVPAIHEESELYNTGGLTLSYKSNIKYIFDHNNFFFSGLICNDLLNIDYRQVLRGKIDMLVIVEWNKDVDMYNNIVAATSNDLHCFVAQVNNRSYGDTRLRGPFKENFERDVARIKGGDLDFFVVTSVKAIELREFQRNYKSPEKPFKPVPTGFEISEFRRLKDLKN